MRIAEYGLFAAAGGTLVIGFFLLAATAGTEPPPTGPVGPSIIGPVPTMRSILPPPPMPKA